MRAHPADVLLDSQGISSTLWLFTLHRAGGGLAPVAFAFERAPVEEELRAALEATLARYPLPIATPERAAEVLRAAGLLATAPGDLRATIHLDALFLNMAHQLLDERAPGAKSRPSSGFVAGCRACAARDFNYQGFVLSLQLLEVLP